MEDHEIVERVKKGEVELFEILVRRHEGRLYALAWKMLHNRCDAQDAAQEVFMKAYRSLKGFRGDAQFYTWLYRIALNHILNLLRRGSRLKEADLEEMESQLNPSKAKRQKELQVAVARAIDELPPRQRAIFHMRYEEERSHAEIAQILGLSEGAVKTSYHHAVKKLRRSLKDFVPLGDK